MPLKDEKDIDLTGDEYHCCRFCITIDDEVKICEYMLEGDVDYLISEEGFSRERALKKARKNMSPLPPYLLGKKHECPKGKMLSDEEFKRLFGEEKK